MIGMVWLVGDLARYKLYITGCVAQIVQCKLRLVTNKTQLIRSCAFLFVSAFIFHKLRSRETCGVVCAVQSEERELLLTNKEQLICSCAQFSGGKPPNTNTHTNTNTKADTYE